MFPVMAAAATMLQIVLMSLDSVQGFAPQSPPRDFIPHTSLRSRVHSRKGDSLLHQTLYFRTAKDPLAWNTSAVDHPQLSVEMFRRRFGVRKSFWGDWGAKETRMFYTSLLPMLYDIGGDMSLEDRAKLAATARKALREYARERSKLPTRLVAQLYDGVRHLLRHGSWKCSGLDWDQIYDKYEAQVKQQLGDAPQDIVRLLVYETILEKACTSNPLFDSLAGIPKLGDASTPTNSSIALQ